MSEDVERIPITVDLTVDLEPGMTKGHMRMKFSDTSVTVSNNRGELGKISGVIGGGVEIAIGDYYYFLSPRDLWNAAIVAHADRLAKREALLQGDNT